METYQDIIKEITKPRKLTVDMLPSHTFQPPNQEETMAVMLCQRVRDAVAGDPHEWYVLDANNEKVHIGDMVKRPLTSDKPHRVQGFICDGDMAVFNDGGNCLCDELIKVTPDTREKIISDAVEELLEASVENDETLRKIFGEVVDRAMKLEAES